MKQTFTNHVENSANTGAQIVAKAVQAVARGEAAAIAVASQVGVQGDVVVPGVPVDGDYPPQEGNYQRCGMPIGSAPLAP